MNTTTGDKIRRLRIKSGLTQDELAARAELPKGFISQIERDQVSPSVAMLSSLLSVLDTTMQEFFTERPPEKIVFREEEMPEKQDEELGYSMLYLIPAARKIAVEPVLLTLEPGGTSEVYDPFEGEEFGYVLMGTVNLNLGSEVFRVRKGDSFYLSPSVSHFLSNVGRGTAKVLWLSTPPSF